MKQKSLFSIKDVVAIGVGAALFVVIAMLQIPAPAPNTSIQLQYALQALFSVVFGPIVGFLIGLIGHAIKDAMSGSLWVYYGLFKKERDIPLAAANAPGIIFGLITAITAL